MNNWGSNGITGMIILIAIMLVTVTAAGIITGSTTEGTTDTEDLDQLAQEVIDEISTYLQIKDQKGKFYQINDEYKIKRIAILISPLVSQEIDATQLTIQLDNGENVRILSCIGSAKIDNSNLFGHSLWNNINGTNFGLISIIDQDGSISDYNVINENTDNCYIVFELPSSMTMEKYQELIVKLFPSSGIAKTLNLRAPMPMKSVITFE